MTDNCERKRKKIAYCQEIIGKIDWRKTRSFRELQGDDREEDEGGGGGGDDDDVEETDLPI